MCIGAAELSLVLCIGDSSGIRGPDQELPAGNMAKLWSRGGERTKSAILQLQRDSAANK